MPAVHNYRKQVHFLNLITRSTSTTHTLQFFSRVFVPSVAHSRAKLQFLPAAIFLATFLKSETMHLPGSGDILHFCLHGPLFFPCNGYVAIKH